MITAIILLSLLNLILFIGYIVKESELADEQDYNKTLEVRIKTLNEINNFYKNNYIESNDRTIRD